jgi:hypothetical protein
VQVPMIESTFQSFAEMPALYIHPHRCREWLPHLPPGVATPLLKNRRLIRRLSALIAAHYALSKPAPVNKDDLAIALLDIEALLQLIHLSGAIFYGQSLRTEISGTAIAGLLSGLDPWTYEAAVKHADLGENTDREAEEPDLLTRESLLRAGHRCFFSWVKTLPPSIAARVWLKFPENPGKDDPPAIFDKCGPKIVRAAAQNIFLHASQ